MSENPHARSIKAADLENLGLAITNYSGNAPLNEAITRYYTLLRMSFESTPIYKIFETKDSQIYRHVQPVQFAPPAPRLPSQTPPPSMSPSSATAGIECGKCKHKFKVQISLKKGMRLKEGALPYPISTDSLDCPRCGHSIDVAPIRKSIETQFERRAV